jgi:hypothetical protein
MTNLIPPSAKKSIKVEYWVRVLTVWFLLFAGALFLGIFILIPSYVLISSQVTVYSQSAQQATERVVIYDNVSEGLVRASQQAAIVLENKDTIAVSRYLDNVTKLQNQNIQLTDIQISKTKNLVNPIRLLGEASSRQALASFRERLLAEPYITAVDLPISNLAQDRDISFSLTVTIDNAITP